MVNAKTLFAAFLPALATSAPTDQSAARGLTTGSLTWYTEGIGLAATACGTWPAVTDHIVALNSQDYGTYANPNDSPVCGKTVRIHGPNGGSVEAKVADRCAGCSTGDIDVTPTVFGLLGYAQSVGRVQVNWEYV